MAHSINTLDQIIMSLLLEGSNYLIGHSETFGTQVDKLMRRARSSPNHTPKYLNALTSLKAELESRAPFIKMIENDLSMKQLEVSSLIDEGFNLKQSMMTHVLSIAAFIDEESTADMHRKREIKCCIQENMVELLEKKKTYQTTKMKLRAAGRGMSRLLDQMEVVEEFKEIIEEAWVEAVEAASCM